MVEVDLTSTLIVVPITLGLYIITLAMVLAKPKRPCVRYRIPSLLVIQTIFNGILAYVSWGNSALVSVSVQDTITPCFLARLLFFAALPTVEVVFLIRVWTLGLFYQSFQKLLQISHKGPGYSGSALNSPLSQIVSNLSSSTPKDETFAKRNSLVENKLMPVVHENEDFDAALRPQTPTLQVFTETGSPAKVTEDLQQEHNSTTSDRVFDVNMKILRFFLNLEEKVTKIFSRCRPPQSSPDFHTSDKKIAASEDSLKMTSQQSTTENNLQNAFFRLNWGIMTIMFFFIFLLEIILMLIMTFISKTKFKTMQVSNCDRNDYILLYVITLIFLFLCWFCTYFGLKGIVDSLGIRRELLATCLCMTITFLFIVVQRIVVYFVLNDPDDRAWNFGTPLFFMSILFQTFSVAEPIYELYISNKFGMVQFEQSLAGTTNESSPDSSPKNDMKNGSASDLLRVNNIYSIMGMIVRDKGHLNTLKVFMSRQLCLENIVFLEKLYRKRLKLTGKTITLGQSNDPFAFTASLITTSNSNSVSDFHTFCQEICRDFVDGKGQHHPELNLSHSTVSKFRNNLKSLSALALEMKSKTVETEKLDTTVTALCHDLNSITREVCRMVLENSLRPFMRENPDILEKIQKKQGR